MLLHVGFLKLFGPKEFKILPPFFPPSFLSFLLFPFNISWGQNVMVHVLEATALTIIAEVMDSYVGGPQGQTLGPIVFPGGASQGHQSALLLLCWEFIFCI